MAFNWKQPSTWFKPSPPKTETRTDTVTTAPVYSAQPSPTGPATVTVVTPPKTTTTYSGPSSGYSSSGGGSRTTTPIQGPVQQGTTPAQEQEFRETGKITPAGASTSATQVQDKSPTPSQAYDPFKKEPYVKSISSVTGSSLDRPYYREDTSTGLKRTFGDIGFNIGAFFTGKDLKPVTNPFKFSGQKRDMNIQGMTRMGTLTTSPMGVMQSPFITYGEVAKDIESKDIIKEFKVRDTAIKDLEAGKDFDAINEQYKKDIDNIRSSSRLSTDPTLQNLYERPAIETSKNILEVGKVVGTAGAFAVSPALGTGIVIASGIGKITKKPTKEEAFLDVGQSLKFTDDGRIVSVDTPLSKEYKSLRTSGGLSLVAGGAGGIAIAYGIGRDITRIRFEEGLKKPTFTSTRAFEGGGVSITRPIKDSATFDLFQKSTFYYGPQGQITGSGKTTVRVLDFMKQGTKDYAWVSKSSNFGFGTRQPILGTFDEGIRTFGIGGYSVRGGEVSQLRVAGISKDFNPLTVTSSGKVTGIRYYPVTGEKTAIIDRFKDIGIIKPSFIDSPTGVTTDIGRTFTGGTKTPFSTTFSQGQGLVQDSKIVFSPIKPSADSFVSKVGRTIQINLPKSTSQFSGLGIYERTTDMTSNIQRPVTGIIQVPKVDSVTRNGLVNVPVVITSPFSTGRSSSGVTTIPIQNIRLDQPQQQILKPLSPLAPSRITPLPFAPLTPFKPFAFKLPKPPLGDGGLSGLGNIKASRTFRLATSFGVARQKGFKVGELSTTRFTGLEARDIGPKKKTKKRNIFGFKF